MKREIFIFLLVFLLTVGCVSNASTPTSAIPLNTLLPIIKHTPTPSPIPSPIPSPTSSFDDKCIEVETVDLNELKSDGMIVLQDSSYRAYTIDANIFKKVEIAKENEVVFSIAVSPNRQMVAYELYSRSDDTRKLVIVDSSGTPQLNVPWEENWTFISSWLDNQRLLINSYDESSDGVPGAAAEEFSTFIAVNPFTGERRLLPPDYPEIYSHHMFPAWAGFGSTVYNPALDRVVYLKGGYSSDDGVYRYVLWAIDEKRTLVEFKVIIGNQDVPRWAPNGEKFAIALNLFDEDPHRWPAYNLYIVDRGGEVVRLTDLSKYYPWVYIDQHSWSPDSKYIAFWFSGWIEQPEYSDLNINQHLAVIDTETGNLSNYCVTGKSQGNGIVHPPVWSPNGQQILIESPLSENHSQVLLFDLNKKIMTVVGNDMTPVGWMVAP